MKEFATKKKELTVSDEESCAGSDSEPSEDNMSDSEMNSLLPNKLKKKRNSKLVSLKSLKKRQREIAQKLKEKAAAKREELEKSEKKARSYSPKKRLMNGRNILKDRFNLQKGKKVQMIDAWTQTSNPDTEERIVDIVNNVITGNQITESILPSTELSPIRIRSPTKKFRMKVG